MRLQVVTPFRREVGDVAPDLVELNRAQLEHVGAEEADLVVLGTTAVELPHPADEVEHRLGPEHEHRVAHDERGVALPGGDLAVDGDPAR